jgi:hypothetical protein
MFKAILFTFLTSLVFVNSIHAQSMTNYTFSTSTPATPEDMSINTNQLIAGSSDDVASSVTNIGFTFYFMGVPYTQFSVNSNGQMRLGSTVISSGDYDVSNAAPLIVPMSADNYILSTGKVHYKLVGASPNRKLVVEWKDIRIPKSSTGIGSQIQVLLFESTGEIEFIYGTVSNNSSPATTRSAFISSSNTTNTVKYIDATMVSAMNGTEAFSFTLSDPNTALLNSRVYDFTPPVSPISPTWKAIPLTQVSETGLTLNWNDLSTNESGFYIYRLNEGAMTYSLVAAVPSNTTSFMVSGILPGSSMNWKVAAYNEGTASCSPAIIQPVDWNTPSSWVSGQVPTFADDVIIPWGRIVTINTANATCRSLSIGGTLTSTDGTHTLAVYGDLSVDGDLTAGTNVLLLKGSTSGAGWIHSESGTLVYAGSLPQTISNIASDGVNNLVIDNKSGVTLPVSIHVNSTLTIDAGAKLTNPGGANMTVKNVIINSDFTNGTGTFVDNGVTTQITGGVSKVQQYLTGGRNWYVSSPVTTATPGSIQTGTSVSYYNEPSSEWVMESSALQVLKGYVATIGSTGTITFSGSALNTGNLSNPMLTSSLDERNGFNLIGNPYPSYLNWDLAFSHSSNLEPTMWYRTKNSGNSAYVFDTYNAISHIGTGNNGVDATALIPPVQGFWLRVASGFTSGTVSLNNSMRSHDVAMNQLRAPSTAIPLQQVLRLQVSNGENSDQAIVIFNSNASDGFDVYDSEKMPNNNASVPEIYTLAGTEPVVINGLKSTGNNPEVPLGFIAGESNVFTIQATEMSNFNMDTPIILRDKLLHIDTELKIGNVYRFNSEQTSTSSRFSILFKSSSITTGLDDNGMSERESIHIYKNQQGQITVSLSISDCNGKVIVYDMLGQQLTSKPINGPITLIDHQLKRGSYLVSVDIRGIKVTKKIIY